LVVEKLSPMRKWLVSPEDTNTGVCLQGDLRVELLYIPTATRRRYRLKDEEKATFKLSYRWFWSDVFLLDSGKAVPFQNLEVGQVIRVLSSETESIDEVPAAESEVQDKAPALARNR
jgi:hypothetical protein